MAAFSKVILSGLSRVFQTTSDVCFQLLGMHAAALLLEEVHIKSIAALALVNDLGSDDVHCNLYPCIISRVKSCQIQTIFRPSMSTSILLRPCHLQLGIIIPSF